MHNYLVRVLVVLLHARFSVVSPIPFLLAAIFFRVIPIIGSTTALPVIFVDTIDRRISIIFRVKIFSYALTEELRRESCVHGHHIYGILVLKRFCSARGIPTTWWIDTLFFACHASLSCL